MSESDSFIREVTEEIRQDRMFRLWKRYGPYVIGAIIAIVAGAAVWNWLEHRAVVEARETGGAFLAAELESVDAQEALLETVDDEAEVVAELRLAASLMTNDENARAADVYRRVAAREEVAPAYRHLALLNAVKLEAETAEPARLIDELAPLVEAGAPYRPMALELRGVLHLEMGEVAAARNDLEAALASPGATADTQRRVVELLAALGPGSTAE